MLFLFIFLINCEFTFVLSGNGLELTIKGGGTIDQKIARQKGSYKLISKIIIDGANTLATSAFESFTSLKEIVLPTTLKKIESYCFKECSSLQKVVIPEGIEELTEGLFFNCKSLVTISLPNSLNSISKNKVFTGTKALREIIVGELNNHYKSIESNSYLVSKNGTILYKGPSSADQVIPKSVKVIESHYSFYCSLKSISFRDSTVEEIKTAAFLQENIEEIILPNTIKIIHENFFSDTLKRLTIPDSVEYFDSNALSLINGLTELNVGPNSKVFKSINGCVFDINETVIFFISPNISNLVFRNTISYISQAQVKSHNIKSVSVDGWSDTYHSYGNILYQNNFRALYACPGGIEHVEVISNCTTIRSQAFSGCLVKTVKLPEGMKIINSAFFRCTELESINIPKKKKKLDAGSGFADCFKLKFTNAVFPKTLQLITVKFFRNVQFGVLDFSQCVLLEKLDEYCFQSCTIEKLILPPKLISLEKSFSWTIVDSVEFPESTVTIGLESFLQSTLKTVTFAPNCNLETIGVSAFEKTRIETISLPKKLKTLSDGSFRNCTYLKSIYFDEASELETIGFEVICECINLTEFEIPKNVKTIAEGAFSGSTGLINFVNRSIGQTYIVIDGILFIDEGKTLFAFPGGRESGIAEKSVRKIAAMAFRKCYKLSDLVFEQSTNKNEGILEIGSYTFYLCTSLNNLIIPSSIMSIEKNAFDGCESLQDVRFGYGEKSKRRSNSFSLEKLNESLFENCKMLERLDISNLQNLKDIGDRCLYGCVSLKSLTFPNSMTSIGSSSFENCQSLEIIRLDRVKTIGSRSFAGCKSLNFLMIGSPMEKVGSQSFDNCIELSKIIYCGKSESAFAGFTFRNINAKYIFVSRDLAVDKLGGLQAIRVVDDDCQIPTAAFSAAIEFLPRGTTGLSVVMCSTDDEC